MTQEYETFVGRLGKLPDFRYTKTQKPVCYLSVAVNNTNQETTQWKQVVVWGKQAELCSVQLKKGSEVFVQGCVQIRSWKTKEGEEKRTKEINAKLIGFTNL